MNKKLLFLVLAIIMLVALPACSAFAPQPTVTPTALPPTATVAPSQTPVPSETPQPTATATLTLTPTETLVPTATETPTPMVDFPKFRLISVDKKAGEMSLIFQIPGIKDVVPVKMDGKSLFCQVVAEYADRLFCQGPEFRIDSEMPVQFLNADGSVAYAGTVFIPSTIFAPTLPAMADMDACPDRGKNVSCETEDRVWFDPPCVVSTCVDACGYYYSIDTCKNSTPPPGFPN